MNDPVTIQLPRGFTLALVDNDRSYTIATIDPPLPVETAMLLADAPSPRLPFRRGDGLSTRLGEVIRAHGHGCGLSGDELAAYCLGADVEHWHVDTPEGVGVSVASLTEELASGTLDADAARAQHRARKTDAVLRELAEFPPGGIIATMILDGAMDAGINTDDPRWVALTGRLRAERPVSA